MQRQGQALRIKILLTGERMKEMKYVCDLCGWEYDEEAGYADGGIEAGTAWADVPEDFECPLCGAGKDQFSADE